MKKESIPFGDQMNMKVAFSTAIAVEIVPGKKMAWISGVIDFDEKGERNMEQQTEKVILGLKETMEKLGGTLDDIVEVTIFVKEMSSLADVHRVRLKYFNEPFPASTLVQVTEFVNPNALIEINAHAVIGS